MTEDLTAGQLDLRARAREFVEEILMPLEQDAERLGGRLPEADVRRIREEAIARRLHGGRHAVEDGGQGWTMLEWFLVNEQFGRVTNHFSPSITQPPSLRRAVVVIPDGSEPASASVTA
ncbi:MAG: acyl-CoA dehydrogenase family protein [Solirubrobacteraceae bacterium]